METAKFRQNEFDTIRTAALSRFKKELGAAPKMKDVRKSLPNPFTVNALELIAFVLLIVLTLFTSIKVGLVALPFVDNMVIQLSQHAPIDPNLVVVFKIVGIALFVMLATPGLIYFKLLSDEASIKERIQRTSGYEFFQKFSLSYITPRLPAILVYATVLWMVYWSSQLPGTIFEQYLGVVAEVALAQLVGSILAKRAEYERAVKTAWKALNDEYKSRLVNYETDNQYLRILYQIMREQYIHLDRTTTDKKRVKPNLWLETADANVVDHHLEQEYRRLTGGHDFVARITTPTLPSVTPTVDLPYPPIATSTVEKRVPPRGDKVWTTETLYNDIRSRGISTYSERQLNADYAKGYKAREVWRSGLNERFS